MIEKNFQNASIVKVNRCDLPLSDIGNRGKRFRECKDGIKTLISNVLGFWANVKAG